MQQYTRRTVFRRMALALIGALGLGFEQHHGAALAQEDLMAPETTAIDGTVERYATVQAVKSQPGLRVGQIVATAGFHAPGDGGDALYRIDARGEDLLANEADIIALGDDRVAMLLQSKAVNYRMFGAVGDGEHDDGVQIKLAHEYARRQRIPVVNRSGEFWITQTNSIPITTNVDWGNTVFHIDERYNDRRNARFHVLSDEPTKDLGADEELKAALLQKLRPGVQIISELAPYAGHLITVQDSEDRIGIRAGYTNHRGWAREELFYVEEEGRIIGDIAWEFKDFTSIRAAPCHDTYLIVQGGGFRFSGDTPAGDSKGYHHHGISIRRSRTIVREQWMGLAEGKRDDSIEPRNGFYVLSGVYDVTLENIRAMPWEKNRPDKDRTVAHGTYGISGARMLNCTFRNLTAEAGWVSWGVFGTNLNKNFRLENCRLNRVDVHFHCWNLTIRNCTIGFKGISVTGGGELIIENTTRDGNNFVSFRRDYGSKWDGRIRLSGCTLRPTGTGPVSVLAYRMADFDYKHPIGYGRSIVIEDMTIDYSAAPTSEAPCWLISTVPFSRTKAGERLFFPQSIQFRDIRVEGRAQGVRLLRIPDPYHYHVGREGGYDGSHLRHNCTLVCENVQLEKMTPARPEDTDSVHLLIGGQQTADYADPQALYPRIRFSDCEHVSVYLGNGIASAFFERCSINTVAAPALRGELAFDHCRFLPDVQEASGDLYTLDSTLGTRFTNCTFHAPVIGGNTQPDMVHRTGVLDLNKAVRHFHLNSALCNRILKYCREQGIVLEAEFIARLKLHHGMDKN